MVFNVLKWIGSTHTCRSSIEEFIRSIAKVGDICKEDYESSVKASILVKLLIEVDARKVIRKHLNDV